MTELETRPEQVHLSRKTETSLVFSQNLALKTQSMY